MVPLFKNQPELPPALVIVLTVAVFEFLIMPGLRLGPLGMVVSTTIIVALAFAMGRRVASAQAQRRGEAAGASQ